MTTVVVNSAGRGPAGHVRNVRAMSDEKLVRETRRVLAESPLDDEVVEAFTGEILRRIWEARKR